MEKLGTEKHPLVLRVHSQERVEEYANICEKNGWEFIIGIEPDKPEDISDIHRMLNPQQPIQVASKIGRNDSCPCGSGKKYKKCCINKTNEVNINNYNLDTAPICGLCGKKTNLTKTSCCDNWICDDEHKYVPFSYERNSCIRNHKRFTLCGHHFYEGHDGKWQDCEKCREEIETEMYVYYGTNECNFEKLKNPPKFKPKRCKKCGSIIRIGENGFTAKGKDYWCMNCTEIPD